MLIGPVSDEKSESREIDECAGASADDKSYALSGMSAGEEE